MTSKQFIPSYEPKHMIIIYPYFLEYKIRRYTRQKCCTTFQSGFSQTALETKVGNPIYSVLIVKRIPIEHEYGTDKIIPRQGVREADTTFGANSIPGYFK